MAELFWTIWGDFVYRAFAVVITVEMLLFLFFMGWLLKQLAGRRRDEQAEQRFADQIVEGRSPIEMDDRARARWMERVEEYPEKVVRGHIVEKIEEADWARRSALMQVYRQLGFAAADRQAVGAASMRQRVAGLRRMVVTATPGDREVLLDAPDDSHLVRILKARIFARIGRAEDIVEVFGGVELQSRLMEEPIYGLLLEVPREVLERVFAQWEVFESPRLQRILLDVAADARLEIEACLPRLEQAAEAEDMELRIGACRPAGAFDDPRTLALLMEMLDDEAWQVRARAATALGNRGDPKALEALAGAMEDAEFWVRQNAAAALRAFGGRGRAYLEEVASGSGDRFAQETASQELGRAEMDAEVGVLA